MTADTGKLSRRPPSGNMPLLDQLAIRPFPDDLVEGMAEAIYMAHWTLGPDVERGNIPWRTPTWETASENVRDWVLKQAIAALEHLSRLAGGGR